MSRYIAVDIGYKEDHIMNYWVACKNDGKYIITEHDPARHKDRYLFGFGPYTKAEAIAWRNTLHTA